MKKISFRNDVLPLKNELYRLALRITMSREEAEDIVQDTLIKVWDKRSDWGDIGSIKSYKEIAEVLNISEEQVKVNIFRARQAVKQLYLKLDNYGL